MAMEFAAELITNARAISAPGKGILAADESTGTIGKRFAQINVENNQDNRRAYRELLFRTPDLGKYISGAILYEETLFDVAEDGETKLVDLLKAQGILPGIKVDMGVQPLYGTDGETVTQGITKLAERCTKYYEAGARFAKWRAVLHIKDASGATPSQLSIDQNASTLARYGAICQACGLVPIIEPEVLMDGEHTIEHSAVITERVLAAVYKNLSDHHLLLEGTLLKPNMVRSGEKCPVQATPAEIALATVRVLQHTVPVAVPGITFLSGGMSEIEASATLNEMNKLDTIKPWSLTFSYGRALQQSCLKAWQGSKENVGAAQEALMIRAESNSKANLGTYDRAADPHEDKSLYVANYSY